MSDESSESKSACPHPEAVGTRWGDSISEERQRALKTLADKQREWAEKPEAGREDSYFKDVILTGADVFWLAAFVRAWPNTDEFWLRFEQEELTKKLSLPSLEALHLEGADLTDAHLEQARLCGVHLEGANLSGSHLQGAIAHNIQLERAFLYVAHLAQADLREAKLSHARLERAQLRGTKLFSADLRHADLALVNMDGIWLQKADLTGANLVGASLENALLRDTTLSASALWYVTFNDKTDLTGVVLGKPEPSLLSRVLGQRAKPSALLADIHWNGADVTRVNWSSAQRLGEEFVARAKTDFSGKRKSRKERQSEFQTAARAYRQVSACMRQQGMTENADHFAYRAQVCQRRDFLWSLRLLRWLFSWFLCGVAGYGYRPLRTLFWYLTVIVSFALAYHVVGPTVGVPLSPLGSVVFSVTSFHGRGFFPGGSPGHSLTLDDPLTVLAAAEAIVGLFIEISFIATFTQRFFTR